VRFLPKNSWDKVCFSRSLARALSLSVVFHSVWCVDISLFAVLCFLFWRRSCLVVFFLSPSRLFVCDRSLCVCVCVASYLVVRVASPILSCVLPLLSSVSCAHRKPDLAVLLISLLHSLAVVQMCVSIITAWSKSQKEERAPHILKMIGQFNRVSHAITAMIVSQTKVRGLCVCVCVCVRVIVRVCE
jgi:RasGEF domain